MKVCYYVRGAISGDQRTVAYWCQRFLSTCKHSSYLALAHFRRAGNRQLRTRHFQTATFLNARQFKAPVCFHGTSRKTVYILHESDSQFRRSDLIYLVRTYLLRSVRFLEICLRICNTLLSRYILFIVLCTYMKWLSIQLLQQVYDEILHLLSYTMSINYAVTFNTTELEKEPIFRFMHI